VLLRLRERRGGPRVDPRRALSRLQQRAAAARTSLRDLKNEQKERLRQYYATAVAGGGSKVASSSSEAALVAAEQQPAAAAAAATSSALDARAAQAALGTDGVLRVSARLPPFPAYFRCCCDCPHATCTAAATLLPTAPSPLHCMFLCPSCLAAPGPGGRGRRLQAVPCRGGAHQHPRSGADGGGAGEAPRAGAHHRQQPCGLYR
jgi:hypothetical protein